MECGIVGLPNVGKSTLFNALTATSTAQAANYPFCTIEPNVGTVLVPDPRLEQLAALAQSRQQVPVHLRFVDIAGLVKGASQGEGLGNQFLSHIREVDAILQVIRCFPGEVTHVAGKIDPLSDIATIETELMLADLQSLERRLISKKKAKPDAEDLTPLLEKARKTLAAGQFAALAPWEAAERAAFPALGLLTLKPVIYVCNVGEEELRSGIPSPETQAVITYAQESERPVLSVCSQIEAEIALLPPEEQNDFLTLMGLKETGLSQIIRTTYTDLGLITFFTLGPKEAHAWTIKKGATAFDAAGVIHTDFQKGFIRAEIISYADYIAYPSVADIKAAGKVRLEGRDYQMQDGDITLFRFNV